MNKCLLLYLLPLVLLPSLLFSNPFFKASDRPSDDGKAVDLSWQVPAGYDDLRIEKLDSLNAWVKLTKPLPTDIFFSDNDAIEPDNKYSYRLIAISATKADSLVLTSEVIPTAQWFNYRKVPLLIMLLILCIAVIYYILSARSGKELFIRRINGLESMDEAVGRATEKGKPILFVPGIGDLDDIQTIAALTILSQLAFKAATYDADLIVPVSKSMVLSTAREIVKEAYIKAGRADAYKQDNIFYLTDDQFGYVAGIDGIMVREQPAANFFLGTFYAEALILAETGFATGAMQTSGTAQPSQLPFFVVSCDYTLIGEELFAASAYLSKEPNQLGSLKGQDFGKFLIVLLILIGSIMEIAGIHWLKNFLMLE
jgi:hypothetical protein